MIPIWFMKIEYCLCVILFLFHALTLFATSLSHLMSVLSPFFFLILPLRTSLLDNLRDSPLPLAVRVDWCSRRVPCRRRPEVRTTRAFAGGTGGQPSLSAPGGRWTVPGVSPLRPASLARLAVGTPSCVCLQDRGYELMKSHPASWQQVYSIFPGSWHLNEACLHY